MDSQVRVDADDPVVGDLLAGMLEVLAEAGGWLHPQARLTCRSGDLGLQCPADDGQPLVRIPHAAMIPVGRLRWTATEGALSFPDLPDGLDGAAIELAYLQVALLNQCAKLSRLQGEHPLLAPMSSGVIDAVRAFRPSFRTQPIDPISLLWSTRCFRLRTRQGPAEPVVIPIVDLLDHHRGGASGTGTQDAFAVPVGRPRGDDACLLDYGWQRDPIGMAVVYGFADGSCDVAYSAPLRIDGPAGMIEVRGIGRDGHGRPVPMRAEVDGNLLRISHVGFGPACDPVAELMVASGFARAQAQAVIEAVAIANLRLLGDLHDQAMTDPGAAAIVLVGAARHQQALIQTFPEPAQDGPLT